MPAKNIVDRILVSRMLREISRCHVRTPNDGIFLEISAAAATTTTHSLRATADLNGVRERGKATGDARNS